MKYGNKSSDEMNIRKEIADVEGNGDNVVDSSLFKILFSLTE